MRKVGVVKRIATYVLLLALTAGGAVGLWGRAQAQIAGNIDPENKWAWSTTVGWIDFDPSYGGVTVHADHLEGYAWGENAGWIRPGTYTGGGRHIVPANPEKRLGILWKNASDSASIGSSLP